MPILLRRRQRSAQALAFEKQAPKKHLWGESLVVGRHGRDGALQATVPACAPTRARRWRNNDEYRARRLPA